MDIVAPDRALPDAWPDLPPVPEAGAPPCDYELLRGPLRVSLEADRIEEPLGPAYAAGREAPLALAYAAGRFGVTWRRFITPSIQLLRTFDRQGQGGPAIELAARVSVLAGGPSAFGACSGRTFGLLSFDGRFTPKRELPMPCSVLQAARDGGWIGLLSDRLSYYFGRLDATGAAVGVPRFVLFNPTTRIPPSLAELATGASMVFRAYLGPSQLMFMPVEREAPATWLEAVEEIGGVALQLVAVDEQQLLFFLVPLESEAWQYANALHLQRLDAEGKLVGAPLVLSKDPSRRVRDYRAVWDGARLLVLLVEEDEYPAAKFKTRFSLRLMQLGADGVRLVPDTFVASAITRVDDGLTAPLLAVDPSTRRAFAVWARGVDGVQNSYASHHAEAALFGCRLGP